MMHQGPMVTNQGRQLAGPAALLAGCAALLGLAGLPDLALAQDSVAAQAPTAYRDLPYIGSRNLVWIIAQLHLLLAGFVLGVPIFAWLCEIVGWKCRGQTLRQAGEGVHQAADFVLCHHGSVRRHSAISPDRVLSQADELLDGHLLPVLLWSTALLFLVETATLYLYWYGWDAMQRVVRKHSIFSWASC